MRRTKDQELNIHPNHHPGEHPHQLDHNIYQCRVPVMEEVHLGLN